MKKIKILIAVLVVFLFVGGRLFTNNKEQFIEDVIIEFNDEKPMDPPERLRLRHQRKGFEWTPDNVRKAAELYKRKAETQEPRAIMRDGGVNSWIEKGPFGVGGRVKSFVVDPNDNTHIFIGSVGGGIWETFDSGTNWNTVNDYFGSLAIGDMEYDPFNSQIIYASTGEGVGAAGANGQGSGGAQPGIGILKSINNGATWQPINTPVGENFVWVNDILLDPNNQGWLYAVTTDDVPANNANQGNGEIFRSQNGGDTWQNIGTTVSAAYDIKMHPINSNIIIVACPNQIYRTSNATNVNPIFTEITGGANQVPANAGRIDIAFAPSAPNTVYASTLNNNVYRSVNGGVTWFPRNCTGLPGNSSNGVRNWTNVVWVDPNDATQIIVGGVDLFRSIDSGTNFGQITSWRDDINGNSNGAGNSIHADHHMILPYNNYNGTSNNGVYIANDGGLYSTNNIWTVTTNANWIPNVGNMAITEFYGGSISSDGSVVIGGAQDNSFSFSIDNGQTWTQPVTGDGGYARVNYNNDSIMFANINNNNIFQTTDRGANWTRIARFTTSTNTAGNCSPSSCCNGNTYFAAGCVSGGVFHAEDNASLISYFTMDPNNPNIILAGGNRLWRNNNNGNANNWTVLTNNIANNIRVTSIEVDFGDTARIWIGYTNGRLERTTDTGTNWSNDIRPGGTLPGNPFVTDIKVNPNNSAEVIVSYAGYNTNNLFYTSNGNAANPVWTNINTGVPLQINSIEWHPSNNDWIYVATDFGVMASEDKGLNWSIFPLYDTHEGPINNEVSEIFWQPSTTVLCAATHGRGIWCSNVILDKIYVDKNYNGTEVGTFFKPFNTFAEALDYAGYSSEIIFKSSGTHDEVNSNLLVEKGISIVLNNGSIIIE